MRLEKLEKLLERLSYESDSGSILIVEGVKDRESLRALGVKGRIVCLQSSRRNPTSFVEGLGNVQQVIVLTDFDHQGVSLAKRLNRTLNAYGTKANLVIWRSLRELTRSDVRSVEELPRYRDRLRIETQNPSFSKDYRKLR